MSFTTDFVSFNLYKSVVKSLQINFKFTETF